jgi:hypothetical protein
MKLSLNHSRLSRVAWLYGACALVLAGNATAQAVKTFGARLSPVPITVEMQSTVSGMGSVTAVLTGRRLAIDGKFQGLRSTATVARVHLSPKAIRGPAIFDLKVSAGTSGTITGTVELTDEQAAALEKGSLYIQLHSEKAPDGNLWGWLAPQEAK